MNLDLAQTRTEPHKKRVFVKPLVLVYLLIIFGAFVAGVYRGSHPAHKAEIVCPAPNICKQLAQQNPDYEVIYYPPGVVK